MCQEKLLGYLDEALKNNKGKIKDTDEMITTSIDEAFMAVENEFLGVARESYKYGKKGGIQASAGRQEQGRVLLSVWCTTTKSTVETPVTPWGFWSRRTIQWAMWKSTGS